MRARAAIAFTLSVTACSIFGGENETPPASEAADATPDAPASEDASGVVPGKDSGEGDSADGGERVPLVCGTSTCSAGETCCITNAGRKCEKLCGGFDFACLNATHCDTGKVCCFSDNASRCQVSCMNRTMCENDEECGAGKTCRAASCNPPALSFKSCAKGGTTFVDLPQDGTCSLP